MNGNKLFLSERESGTLGLKIARSRNLINATDISSLTEEIFQEGYDLCRLKMDGSMTQTFTEINRTGFPYSLFAINYINKIIIPPTQSLPPDIEIVECLPEENKVIRAMVEEIFDTKGWIEYDSDWYNCLVSDKMHKDLALDYFSSFLDAQAGRHTWRLKYRNENAGVFMGTQTGETFGGTFYGILPTFRGEGLAGHIYTAMFGLCHKMGCRFFENEVNIFNLPSMKATVSSKLVPEKITFNVTLFPLLSLLTEKGRLAPDGGTTSSNYLLNYAALSSNHVTYFSSAINPHRAAISSPVHIIHHSLYFKDKKFEIARSLNNGRTIDVAYICLE